MTTFIDATVGPALVLDTGENTAEATRLAGIATDAAATSEIARDVAITAGPHYATIAAGEAATTTGQTFAVAPGDGTLTWRRRTSGGSTPIFEGLTKAAAATKAELAAGTGSSLISFMRDAPGAIARSLADWFDDQPSVMDFIPLIDRVAIRLGTSTADVRGYIQAAIDHVAARGGGDLAVPTGDYRLVINTSVPDRGLIVKDKVRLAGPGRLKLECDGAVYGVRLKNFAKLGGGLTVAVTASTNPGSQSIWHSCISLGDALGFGGTPSDVSSFHNVVGWEIDDVVVTNVRSENGGVAAIACYGGIGNGRIGRVYAPSSSTLYGVVHLDWAYVGAEGTIQSGNIPASRANFDNGSAYTTHPHDITISDIIVGDMSRDISIAVRNSGGHNITIERVIVEGCSVAGVDLHAGDIGYEFAQANIKPFRHKDVTVRNVVVLNARNGNGVRADCDPDNLRVAAQGGYVPLLEVKPRADWVIEGVSSYSNSGVGVAAGVRIERIQGLTLKDASVTGHKQGILIEFGADEVSVVGGVVSGNREDGLLAGHPDGRPQLLKVRGLRSFKNNTSAGSFANIKLIYCDRPDVEFCTLGETGETATFALRVDDTVTGLAAIGNHVKAGGFGYSIGSTGTYGIVRQWRDNSCATGVTTKYGGVEIIIEDTKLAADGVYRRFGIVDRAALVGDTTPAGGAWIAGERLSFTAPLANGRTGTVCTVSGSPGTWNQTGSVAA